jgi:hypothetical protein
MKSKRTVGRHLRSISGLSEVLGDRLRSGALSPQMHFANNSLSNRDLRRDRPADLTDTSMVVPTFRVPEAARSLAQLGTPPESRHRRALICACSQSAVAVLTEDIT